jgi:hypothetical protein
VIDRVIAFLKLKGWLHFAIISKGMEMMSNMLRDKGRRLYLREG